MMRFDILTIFPEMFSAKGGAYANQSILKRAQEKKLIKIQAHNIRDYTKDKHRKVDDRPFGGGAGMVMAAPPIMAAVGDVRIVGNVGRGQAKRSNKRSDPTTRTRVILFSTRGKKFDSAAARRLTKYDQLILICGRYEGVDERVAQYVADEEISIGDFVLTGGELPAMVLIDSVSRQIPGVLGKFESLEEKQGSYKTYTRPEKIGYRVKGTVYRILKVPKVLISGDHRKIEEWRKK